ARPMPKEAVETDTIPIGGGNKANDEEAKPIPLAKTFDSFDATLRLAAMTDQTGEFKEYITQTQKMRAYRGKIEAGSGLTAATATQPTVAAPTPAKAPEKAAPQRQI